MKKLVMTVSFAALAVVVVAPLMFYTGRISLDAVKIMLNTATAVWFLSALCWMGREKKSGV